ncbi:MAG: outer membrane protein [Granulosicoccus sp.]|jgi:outer membrane protein
MKNLIALLFAVVIGVSAQAQRFAYVDTDYILENIPQYNDKQSQLDEIAVQWQGEVEALYSEIDRMYKDFQAEQILLTDEMKKKREDDIMEKEGEAKDLQRQRFGYQGDLFKKRQQLVKPLQDQVYEAIKDVAMGRGYAVIFDKASAMTMLYTNSKYDLSEDILEELGYAVEEGGGAKDGESKTGGSEEKGGGATRPSSGSSKGGINSPKGK